MREWTSAAAGRIAAGELLSQEEWGTSLACTELAFVSERSGSGLDWSTVTGLTDEETIAALRSVQAGLTRWPPARGGA